MAKHIFSAVGWVLLVLITAAQSQELTVIGYNVESGGADPNVVAERIAAIDGCDIWGLSEVHHQDWADTFETAAEVGENADFHTILGTTGGGDRLLIIYDGDRLELLDFQQLHDINIGGNVRAPLVAQLRERSSGQEFFFMVNHLYRGRAHRRHQQATMLREWAALQQLPVIATGDYNFDWSVTNGEADHDQGYDNMTAQGVFEWVRPTTLIKTQDSRHNTVLDFVFVSGAARQWEASATILVEEGDFPDTSSTPDHRPVQAIFSLTRSTEITLDEVLEKIDTLEADLLELKQMVEALR